MFCHLNLHHWSIMASHIPKLLVANCSVICWVKNCLSCITELELDLCIINVFLKMYRKLHTLQLLQYSTIDVPCKSYWNKYCKNCSKHSYLCESILICYRSIHTLENLLLKTTSSHPSICLKSCLLYNHASFHLSPCIYLLAFKIRNNLLLFN